MKTWVDKLIGEYSKGQRQLEKYRATLDAEQKEESDLVGSMISDMRFALEWMRRGRRPGNRRGIEQQSVYQRTVILDSELFPSLMVETEQPKDSLTDEEKRKIIDMLWTLSKRERECYLLHMAHGMSYAEIGKELKISRNTARTFIDRAKSKVQQRIKG